MAKTVVKGLSTSKGIINIPYKDGFYKYEVKTGEETKSRAGNTMFVHQLEILDGPEQEQKVKGRKMTARFSITDSDFTVDKLKDFTNACLLRIPSDNSYDPVKAIGKIVWGRVGKGTGAQGQAQAEVKEFYSEAAYEERAAEFAASAADED